MCQAIEEMKRDSMEEGMQRGIEKGMQQGIEQGMQQGIEQGARKTALNLLQIGMPMEQIAHMVGYSSGEVRQWLLRAKKAELIKKDRWGEKNRKNRYSYKNLHG